MKSVFSYFHILIISLLLAACDMEPAEEAAAPVPTKSSDRLIIVCEGLWGMDNATMSYLNEGVMTNLWFRAQNPGMKLGDTANDIVLVNDTLIAISVNWSNIIQYIHPDGTAIAATEDIPNNRRLATDGVRYLYCTSYANDGYVAKIDIATKQIVDTCSVGYEPEGIAYYDGRLYVANTGGYAFQTEHDYESTVSVIDAETMRELRRIDTGCINLYGEVSQCGQFLCINSAGDYYNELPKTVVLNMANDEFKVFDFPATYNCAYGNRFYVIGSAYSSETGTYDFTTHTIALPSVEAVEGLGDYAFAESTILSMSSPYGIYISPYSGHLYVSDARSYATNGFVYDCDPSLQAATRYRLQGLNPAHFLALP